MILYICPARGRQKHTANHQRAKHVIWIVCLLCSVVHPKALCAWIWLVGGIKEAVCSPLTSVLLFVAALWCIEKLRLGYPLQTNTQEIPLLCIIFNNSLTIHCEAFIPFKAFYFKLSAYCLSVTCNRVSCLTLGDGMGLICKQLSRSRGKCQIKTRISGIFCKNAVNAEWMTAE